ncbi:putative WRKY transcription factor 2 [Cocos nucifera]|uniref:Putative WRKY transcription factor 2 n=1 Tax=Cocos nucifera TaxID=13894 RepID=A0A8K0IQR8_COCNU|nr:putative WRKY transcription factor 2 [Cocos nucifera]
MAGADDNATMIGDWTSFPNPSPRTFLSTFLNEEFGSTSFSDLLAENGNEGPPPGSEKQKTFTDPKEEKVQAGVQYLSDRSLEPSLFGAHKSSLQGGLAERMAARAGFNVPKLNMARITSANVGSSSSDVRSPYLTIPPGLSPTTLLESPVFLSNSMAQPSPTTGKFPIVQHDNSNTVTTSVSAFPNKSKDYSLKDICETFSFKPHMDSSSSYFSSAEKKGASTVDQQQSLPSIEVYVQSGKHIQTPNLETGIVNLQNQQQFNHQTGFSDSSDRKDATDDVMFDQKMSDSFMGNEHSPPPDDQQDGEAAPKELSSMAPGAPAEDGYNWRKYGQKQVKGSEYPRSYYKCTHLNCQMKKKVERSHDGHVTEIIYKGAHNHPKPPPNRRSGVPSSHPFNDPQIDASEQPGSQASFDRKPLWATSTQNGTGGQEWRGDGQEATSSATVAAELCDPSTSIQTQDGPRFESQDAIDVSSTLSNDEEEDDRATHGSVSLGGDGEGDETESKRRKLDACAIEMGAASRAVREPRVVVQTTSEVDILDDGYRWRKYGQKVVKGNPNPRSYYKCTNPGCTVRKHVERASHDLKSVITTYEGKHNHDVPAARNSSHPNSAPSGTAGNSVSQSHSLHRRLEPTQGGLVRFDAPTSLGTFCLPGREQLGPAAAFSFGMGQQGLANLAMAGLGPVASMKMPVLPPVHPFLGHHQAAEAGFQIPKGEPKEEPISQSRLPIPNGGPVYHQMMGRLPLGP